MSKHAPGPWYYRRDDAVWKEAHGIFNEANEAIAWTTRGWSAGEIEEANARLIAAAPDLLAALKSLWGVIEHGGTITDEMAASYRAAIERARG